MFSLHPRALPADGWAPALDEEPRTKRCMQPYCANLVLTSTVNSPLCLPRVVCTHDFLEYNPSAFAAAVGHFDSPHVTVLVFPSGKIVITGAKNMYAAHYVVGRFVDLIRADYPCARVADVRVQNYTCTVDLGHFLDLRRCTQENSKQCEYVPETFPGMHVHSGVGSIRHIAFMTGQIVVTGSRSEKQALESLNAAAALYRRYYVARGSEEARRIFEENTVAADAQGVEEALAVDFADDVDEIMRAVERGDI